VPPAPQVQRMQPQVSNRTHGLAVDSAPLWLLSHSTRRDPFT
jgi:hypothetical protein